MAEVSPPAPLSPLDVELDPEFEPQSRPRSCTWPLQRPELQTSPAKPSGDAAADDASMIPEEDDDADDEEQGCTSTAAVPGSAGEALASEDTVRLLVPFSGLPGEGSGAGSSALSGGQQPQPVAAGTAAAPRKCSSRRNAWGNLSYADLITRAIQSSPEKRLTLSQIYEWMVRCVPYFKDKGDSNSSAGWKVSGDCEIIIIKKRTWWGRMKRVAGVFRKEWTRGSSSHGWTLASRFLIGPGMNGRPAFPWWTTCGICPMSSSSQVLGAASELHSVTDFPKGGKNTHSFTVFFFFLTMIFRDNTVVQ